MRKIYKPDDLFSVSDVARILDTHPSSLRYHMDENNIIRPTTVFQKRKFYTQAELDGIKHFWDNRIPLGVSRFTPEDVATMAGMRLGGMEQADIGKQFGASQAEVSRLLKGKTFAGPRGGLSARRIRQSAG